MVRGRAVVSCLVLLAAVPAAAQNWELDARRIAMGSAGTRSVADRILDEQRPYRSIPLPIGLIQVLRNLDIFRPDSDEFDLVRAIEYSASPFHYIIGRDDSQSDGGRRLVVDIANGTLSRDLNVYRGFVPARQPAAEGLAAPTWGGTIRVAGDRAGTNHGVFIGAGPYLALRTTFDLDQRIIDTLASSTDVYFPNARMSMASQTIGQAALAITGGYRGRYAINGSPSRAVLAAVDYHELRGLRLEWLDTQVRLDTDASGLVTILPAASSPLVISRATATSGRGHAIDVGVAVLVDGWEAAFSINGIGNHIEWRDGRRETTVLGNLLAGEDGFIDGPEVPIGNVRIELPVDYRVRGGHRGDRFSALAEYAHGFNGDSLRGGVEYRLGAIDVRGGAYYGREKWEPTAGIGLNFGPRVSLDVAIFGTAANVERERRPAIAASLRFNRR